MRRLLFVTATRAEWGKLRPLVDAALRAQGVETHVAVTGMHLVPHLGMTACEVEGHLASHPWRVWRIPNGVGGPLATVLSDTTRLLGHLCDALRPHAVVVHGDRCEALAGAQAAAVSNVLVWHVEGGELSGTIDESLRHAVTKLAHRHFVSNEAAAQRVRDMGEAPDAVHVIGSPEVDVMLGSLPTLAEVREHYEIPWTDYGILVWHPVTTEAFAMRRQTREVLAALRASPEVPWVVIMPNADPGCDAIMAEYADLPADFRVLPSMRFEMWLTLLKHAACLVGNSSAGVREAPVYGVPSIDVGTRQRGRTSRPSVQPERVALRNVLRGVLADPIADPPVMEFGDGRAGERFEAVLQRAAVWEQSPQKTWRGA